VYPRVESEGLPRWFAHRLGGAMCRGLCNTRLLLLTLCFCSRLLKKQQLGFLVSLCPLSRICPNCACMQLFLVPDNSYFVAPGEMCLGASTAAKGPKSQFISSVTCICEVFLVRETFYTFTSFRKPPTGSINSICQKKNQNLP